jgi:hypothetical protein
MLFKAALWLTASEADAKDLVADALNRVCDPVEGQPWDPARGRFTAHMRIVMRDLLKKQRSRARTRREVTASSLPFDADAPDPNPISDQALDAARLDARLRRLGGILRERLSRNARTLQVFDLGCNGHDDATELARLIGCTPQDIYDANRQIRYHTSRILAEESQAEDGGMRVLRDRATKKEPT